jgi:hypothetical protein
LAGFALTLGVLLGAWEAVLRGHGSAVVDLPLKKLPPVTEGSGSEEWLLFGNCLVTTGISPRQMNSELSENPDRRIRNIAWHEASPISFFEYLKRENHYPAVAIANVSSWVDSNNFDQESALLIAKDPLDLHPPLSATENKNEPDAYSTTSVSPDPQHVAEKQLSAWIGHHWLAVGHRYHLFDFSMFAGTLATGHGLDDSLYQLNMQSWFYVRGSETDGYGWLGLDIGYRADWTHGLDKMADRTLQRLRFTRVLDANYWRRIEAGADDLAKHGTRVFLLRMPEHPRIRAFNDEAYDMPSRLNGIAERTGASVIDLTALGPAEGVRLFDAIHPDKEAAVVITRELSSWIRSHGLDARPQRAATGG